MWDNSEIKQEALPPKEDNPQTPDEVVTPETKERYKQQIEWSKKEADRKESLLVDTYTDLVSQDASHLDKLHEKDPKLADKVAKNFWYTSFDEAKTTLNNPKTSNNGLSEAELEEWYVKRRGKDEHEIAIKKADEILSKLPEEEQEKARAYYDMIVDWKTLTSDSAKEFANMATLYVNKGKIKSDNYSEWLAMLSSTWVTSGSDKKSVSKEPEYVLRNGKLTLLSNDK